MYAANAPEPSSCRRHDQPSAAAVNLDGFFAAHALHTATEGYAQGTVNPT
jgi:hypothetical protein